jgi:hypothetical protein
MCLSMLVALDERWSVQEIGCINAKIASHKLALRLETKPLHILLRILNQEATSLISNHLFSSQRKLTYTTKA